MADPQDLAASAAPLSVRAGTLADHPWVVETARRRLGSERQAYLQRGLFAVTDFPILIAERGGGRVGFVAWESGGEVCEAVAIACAEAGTGVGRALMAALATQARERGCRQLKAVTTDDNEGARGFYEHLGYEVVEVRSQAVDEARRRFKPEIPPQAHDEIEYRRVV